jgi:hypothetical protein
VFREKLSLKIKDLRVPIFQVLGFFDSLNIGVQATAYSIRCAPACSRA